MSGCYEGFRAVAHVQRVNASQVQKGCTCDGGLAAAAHVQRANAPKVHEVSVPEILSPLTLATNAAGFAACPRPHSDGSPNSWVKNKYMPQQANQEHGLLQLRE